MKKLKVGVVGATGMVGQVFMTLLEERSFPLAELRPFASEASIGKKVKCQGKEWTCEVLRSNCFEGLDIVFFSSGDDISKEWAPEAVKAGAYAIDNSAAFRMSPQHALVVPEVNGDLVQGMKAPQVIANPNCSTIQLVVALKPLQEKFGVDEVRVSSYQAVSGAGLAAYEELLANTQDYKNPNPKPVNFVHPILFNVIPQIGSFDDEGFTSEEKKIQNETKKILRQPTMKVSAFAVRVPVLNAHSESVWVTLSKEVSREEMLNALADMPGLVVQDEPKKSVYPMPRDVAGKDPVYVGRIHRDPENKKLWLMWVVSDNIKKGAALNGIQIADLLIQNALKG
ncbi:MAG: aspartate-semialdehyde dehydrogenase [Bdellovibrionaceae bacterium]|nr:aspartate-semialdehyde dehydrogenase [Pseudobdellovibrionaceae bacterium]